MLSTGEQWRAIGDGQDSRGGGGQHQSGYRRTVGRRLERRRFEKAEGIVRYREQNGPFTQVEQLQEVPGIGPALFEKNRTRLKM